MSLASNEREISYIRAVNVALETALSTMPDVIIFGEDVAYPNGPFGATKGLYAGYGDRVFDTPISESAMVGTALGSAMGGLRPIVEIMYADFLMVAMDQIVNQIANASYVSRGKLRAPLVVRTQQGHTPGACSQHSQSLEAVFAHIPGLRVATPATPADAFTMLLHSIASDDPVIFMEARKLYPTKGIVDFMASDAGMGVSSKIRSGSEVTVVTWGTGRQVVEEALSLPECPEASLDVIDLRWISPWDSVQVLESVGRTGRLLVVHEANEVAGFGAEVISTVAMELGTGLRASHRVGLLGTPVPSSPVLSQAVLPTTNRVISAIASLLEV